MANCSAKRHTFNFTSSNAPYRNATDRIVNRKHGFAIHEAVRELSSVLTSLLIDIEVGLLASVVSQAIAETFDDSLDHSEAYHNEKRKNEAGVIAGVVFEDTIRQISRKENLEEKGFELDGLISTLSTSKILSGVQAKRARAAAHVRTKASHAQWDEFAAADVKATIDFTRELITSKLDR